MLAINENDNEVLVSLALFYAKSSEKKKAYNLLKTLENKGLRSDLLYVMSLSYLAMENNEFAVKALSKAINKGYDKEVIKSDENFSALLKNPEFIALLSQ